jgi:mannose-6-phosphate isomerase-like protein (cupin superfamily)
MLSKVNLEHKLGSFEATWVPKIVAELNGQYVKVVKFEGEYLWHHHAEEDELFLVLAGQVEIHLRDGVVRLGPGELVVVPRGVEHKPVAPRLAHVALFEPKSVRNTGNVDHGYTIEADQLERI